VHGFASLWVEGVIEEHFGPIDPQAATNSLADILYAADAGN
jgi:hypothetical protein